MEFCKVRRMIDAKRGSGTWGGAVPYMTYWLISTQRSVYIGKVEHTLWTPKHYIADAESDTQLSIARFSRDHRLYGEYVDKITLAPAIYLLHGSQHAVYSEAVPDGLPVLAIQLRRI